MGLRIKHGTSAQLNSPASIARYRADKTLQYSKIQYRYVSLVSCWFVLANKSKPSRSCCHRLKSLTIYPRGETAKGPGFELSHWAWGIQKQRWNLVKLQALQTATSLSCIIWSHTLRRSWQMHGWMLQVHLPGTQALGACRGMPLIRPKSSRCSRTSKGFGFGHGHTALICTENLHISYIVQ